MVRVSPLARRLRPSPMVLQGASAVQGALSLPDVATTSVSAAATTGSRRSGSVRNQRCIEGLLRISMVCHIRSILDRNTQRWPRQRAQEVAQVLLGGVAAGVYRIHCTDIISRCSTPYQYRIPSPCTLRGASQCADTHHTTSRVGHAGQQAGHTATRVLPCCDS